MRRRTSGSGEAELSSEDFAPSPEVTGSLPNVNMFELFDMGNISFDDALEIPVKEWRSRYRKRARVMHPDKFPPEQRGSI